ncbi:MAG TPA: allophanate hydrolase [Lacunisphaera sp.]|jgi:allophanate hydrolase
MLLSLDLSTLRAAYAAGTLTPTALVEEILQRIEAYNDPAVWIHRLSREELLARAREVEQRGISSQPLYGVPYAIKDNIDLAGVPTTAACPEFAYTPAESAFVVQRLLDAGAISIGKTNLDQFATGLVGVRSPHGVPRNPFHSEMIPGGSSSGSAVAVSAGLASFSLGTDTAGSGRVPASFNNLVGLKPTKGALSTRGVVPACRSLDCVSVFALTVEDAVAVASVAGGYDVCDPFARPSPQNVFSPGAMPATFRFGVPAAGQLEWFGDTLSPECFARAVADLEKLGGIRIEIDFTPFRDAARLLYEGPWVAERWSAVREFHASHADAIWPVTRHIVEGGEKLLAVDAFESGYKLASLRRAADATWTKIDTMVLPTAATIYTRAQLEADPITLNSRLGIYTNFANLLDTAALAVPTGFRSDGLPFGVTLFGPAWSDGRLAAVGNALHRTTAKTTGASGLALPPASAIPAVIVGEIELAVVGAHLTGQPLNGQLTTLGARLLRTTRTTDAYRFYTLPGTTPPKPGLVRGAAGTGAMIEVEVWGLNAASFGSFVAAIPPPLGIGTLQLIDGTTVKGFICEPAALAGANDITSFGGWRAFLKKFHRRQVQKQK